MGANYSRPDAITPPQKHHENTIWNASSIGRFLQLTTYFGSFNLSCDPVRPGGQPSCPPPAKFNPQSFTDYTGSALGARFIGDVLPLFIAFSN